MGDIGEVAISMDTTEPKEMRAGGLREEVIGLYVLDRRRADEQAQAAYDNGLFMEIYMRHVPADDPVFAFGPYKKPE